MKITFQSSQTATTKVIGCIWYNETTKSWLIMKSSFNLELGCNPDLKCMLPYTYYGLVNESDTI